MLGLQHEANLDLLHNVSSLITVRSSMIKALLYVWLLAWEFLIGTLFHLLEARQIVTTLLGMFALSVFRSATCHIMLLARLLVICL